MMLLLQSLRTMLLRTTLLRMRQRVVPLLLLWTVSLLLLAVAPAFAQSFDPEAEQEIVRLVNVERQSRGLATLIFDERLQQAARQHSSLMAATGEVEHQIGAELTLTTRLHGLRFDACGENIALNIDAERAHRALMNSPGHRANILDAQYNAIGIGVIRTTKGIYVTEDFAHTLLDISVDDAEDEIALGLNRLRRAAGKPILNRVPAPDLRRRACQMAASNKLNPGAGMALRNVNNAIAFTATDLRELPASLAGLQSRSASGISVGACYQTSASYQNPVFWFLVVTYF
jgi:uncharacterized protein YkwD